MFSAHQRTLLLAVLFLAVLTLMLTWPQSLYLGTKVADHGDPLLSMWRLAWLTHGLAGSPGHLFDANIFHPFPRTLAFSDATLLEGVLAAPWLLAGARPVLVYNVLLLAGIATSGLGMFVLVRHLSGNTDAALVAAAIFTLVPYRVEHFMHLELQWTVWMPLTLWAVHRVFETGSRRLGALAGVLLSLQVLSSMYYGAFLGIMIAVLALLLAVSDPRGAARAVQALGIAALIAGAVTLVYMQPYLENARALGVRHPDDVARFSARLASYVTAPTQNWLWGWTSNRTWFEGEELHLFTGLVPVLLALFALARRPRRLTWIYLVMTAIAALLSLGLNGPIYGWLYDHVWALRGFRAPARFAILVCCGLAVLAGLGFSWIQQAVRPSRMRGALLVAVMVAIGIEFGSAPMYLRDVPEDVPDVYKFLKTLNRPVVMELPDALSPWYMYWSTTHWSPLVNGYSGYTPVDYDATLKLMRTFPDDESISRLRHLGVQYVLVHQSFYTNKAHTELMLQILQRSDLVPQGRYRDWVGWTQLFELKHRPAHGA